jgi:hypothetical protein
VSVGKFNGTQNSTNSHYSDLLDKQAVSWWIFQMVLRNCLQLLLIIADS